MTGTIIPSAQRRSGVPNATMDDKRPARYACIDSLSSHMHPACDAAGPYPLPLLHADPPSDACGSPPAGAAGGKAPAAAAAVRALHLAHRHSRARPASPPPDTRPYHPNPRGTLPLPHRTPPRRPKPTAQPRNGHTAPLLAYSISPRADSFCGCSARWLLLRLAGHERGCWGWGGTGS